MKARREVTIARSADLYDFDVDWPGTGCSCADAVMAAVRDILK
jgi:hypothetical protein